MIAIMRPINNIIKLEIMDIIKTKVLVGRIRIDIDEMKTKNEKRMENLISGFQSISVRIWFLTMVRFGKHLKAIITITELEIDIIFYYLIFNCLNLWSEKNDFDERFSFILFYYWYSIHFFSLSNFAIFKIDIDDYYINRGASKMCLTPGWLYTIIWICQHCCALPKSTIEMLRDTFLQLLKK